LKIIYFGKVNPDTFYFKYKNPKLKIIYFEKVNPEEFFYVPEIKIRKKNQKLILNKKIHNVKNK